MSKLCLQADSLTLSFLSPQVLTPGLYHYYVTELAFYWSLVFSQFTDIKRKVRETTLALAAFDQTTLDTPQQPLPVKTFVNTSIVPHLVAAVKLVHVCAREMQSCANARFKINLACESSWLPALSSIVNFGVVITCFCFLEGGGCS